MSYFDLIFSINIFGSLTLFSVFFYLYQQYKEKYMFIWAMSWFLFDLRIGLDYLRFSEIFTNYIALLLNQLVATASVLLLLWGICKFSGKKVSIKWLYATAITIILSDALILLGIPVNLAAFPTSLFFGIIQIHTGIIFMRLWNITGSGKYITGISFIIIGIFNSLYPFIPTNTFFTISSFLWLIILIGVLLVYFEKVRADLTKSENRYKVLADNAKDIIYRVTLKPNLKIDYLSPSILKITGYTSEKVYTNPKLLYHILPSSSRLDLDFENLTTDSSFFDKPKDLILITKEGKRVWTENHAVPITNDTGTLIAVEGIIRDISERKYVEQEMARLNQLHILGETAATIAHEIRNPMTSVHGFLQLLAEKPELQEYKHWFHVMRTELERANSIITDYLTFTKEDTGLENANKEEVNLNSIILELSPLLESRALFLSMEVRFELNQLTSELLLNKHEIKQLILNLSQNGFESMSEGGMLTITTQVVNKRHIVLAIKDQGPGISHDILEKLGTPFFTTKKDGTGLGLSVCYQIARRNNSMIEVDTNKNGTTFYVHFKEA